jgi:HSP20 family protein
MSPRYFDHPPQRWGAEPPFPLIDVVELEDGYLVLVELAGVDPAAVRVTVDQRRLVIAGTREPELPAGSRKLLRMELTYGPFRRSLQLPLDIDATGISARWQNGMLHVHVPRQAYRGSVEVETDEDRGSSDR